MPRLCQLPLDIEDRAKQFYYRYRTMLRLPRLCDIALCEFVTAVNAVDNEYDFVFYGTHFTMIDGNYIPYTLNERGCDFSGLAKRFVENYPGVAFRYMLHHGCPRVDVLAVADGRYDEVAFA